MKTLRSFVSATLPRLGFVWLLLCGCGPLGAAVLETPFFRFELAPDTGACTLNDKQAAVHWVSPSPERFGFAVVQAGAETRRQDLHASTITVRGDRLVAEFKLDLEPPGATMRVIAEAVDGGRVLQLSHETTPGLVLQGCSLAENLVRVRGRGYLVSPVREGLLIPADSGLAFTHRFDTYAYEGCHMAMFGAVQDGAALLVSWSDPYIAADVKSVTNAAGQSVQVSFPMRKSARSLRLQPLGRGDYGSIASAYREIARKAGWVVTLNDKIKAHPDRAKLLGAVNYKLWSALDRRMNEDSSQELSVQRNWTFHEAAQIAEHLKRDLQIDRALFSIGGWIHRGYDNQHPDVLPTAPECGGDTAFADCARRVMQLGYLFCPHDNYQDIYRDSPSWDEGYIMRTADGQLTKGGHWAGGVAFLTCSPKALELAERPQNLAAVRRLSGANAYFIDTTYAAGLQECFAPGHPLTRPDDQRWKQALSDYARGIFGVFGSECGREWALPHSDFFEGLTGVSGTYYHDANLLKKTGGYVVPLFEMVYRDCIAMYGKYGYDPYQAAGYVLNHILIGRPLNHHDIPPGLYWLKPAAAEAESERLPLRPLAPDVNILGRELRLTYNWDVLATPAGEWRAFVHFVNEAGEIAFQNDYAPGPPVNQWTPGRVRQGPFTVAVPPGLNGTFAIRTGFFRPDNGPRAVLEGRDNGQRSYLIGRLRVSGDTVTFERSSRALEVQGRGDTFVRGDGGWTEGLHYFDRFVKNGYEITSPLNEITGRMLLTRHAFLSPDRAVQQSTFGEGKSAVTVVVNAGATPFAHSSRNWGKIELTASGFFVESRSFVAFHASTFNGHAYAEPVMFTLRALDGRELNRSRKVRVYHGFGNPEIVFQRKSHHVVREAILQ